MKTIRNHKQAKGQRNIVVVALATRGKLQRQTQQILLHGNQVRSFLVITLHCPLPLYAKHFIIATYVAEDADIEEPLNSFSFQKSWLVFPMGCNMTCEQKANIDAIEQKIGSQIPLYITSMDMTSVSGGFLVSYEFILCSQQNLSSIVFFSL